MSKEELKKVRILSADDDPMTRQLVRAILEADGYDVVSAFDGLNVFELFDENENPEELSCIILDIQMPRMNGLDALAKLKLEDRTKSILSLIHI